MQTNYWTLSSKTNNSIALKPYRSRTHRVPAYAITYDKYLMKYTEKNSYSFNTTSLFSLQVQTFKDSTKWSDFVQTSKHIKFYQSWKTISLCCLWFFKGPGWISAAQYWSESHQKRIWKESSQAFIAYSNGFERSQHSILDKQWDIAWYYCFLCNVNISLLLFFSSYFPVFRILPWMWCSPPCSRSWHWNFH